MGLTGSPARENAPRRVGVQARSTWLNGVFAAGLAFMYLPIVVTAFFSFTHGRTTRFPIDGLSLASYGRVFEDDSVIAGTRNSVLVACGATVLATLIAVPAAVGFVGRGQRVRKSGPILLLFPLFVPTLILGIGLLTLFSATHVTPSLGTVVIAHTLYTAPVVFLVVRARLLDLDPHIHEAARDLGAAPLTVFRLVTFPLARAAIVGAMVLAFALSFDEFVLALFTIGSQNTLPLVVFSELRTGLDVPALSALMTLLVGTMLLLLGIASKFVKIRLD
jgi:ABC-type spermidine/putrescine transport system permease subunit II